MIDTKDLKSNLTGLDDPYSSSEDEDLCKRCGTDLDMSGSDFMKECFKCNKMVCINCVAITSCQTTQSECLDCWDPICKDCGENLDQYLPDGVFPLIDDAPEYDEYFYCPDCWKKSI